MMASTTLGSSSGAPTDACLQIVPDQYKEVYVARLGSGGRRLSDYQHGGAVLGLIQRYALMRSIEGKGRQQAHPVGGERIFS